MSEQREPERPRGDRASPTCGDLRGRVEDSGGALFTDLLGEAEGGALRSPAPSGQQRAAAPGFLLVVGKPPVGFVHVLHLDGFAHLEQVSVLPEQMRRGLGTALVRAADARGRGRRLTTALAVHLPRRAVERPFYARLGFTVVEDLLPFQRRLRAHEASLGLDESGPRVVMSLDLAPSGRDRRGITRSPRTSTRSRSCPSRRRSAWTGE